MTNRKLDIKTTPVFTKNYQAFLKPEKRFIINQGGSRSSKTWSILQLIVWFALTSRNKRVSVCRKTGPALFNTAMMDFIQILEDLELSPYIKWNHSLNTFTFPNGSIVKFFSIDNPQKIRGRAHDIVYLNEANELSYDDFQQINLRTTGKIFIDYNPSFLYSWIYELMETRPESCTLIKSTYVDNPFLNKELKEEIENLINGDDYYYKVYALGETPQPDELIFKRYTVKNFPEDSDFVYGLDFGFKDPCALVKVAEIEEDIYLEEVLYESGLDTNQMIDKFNKLDVLKTKYIYADASRPDQIQSLQIAGWPVFKANKKIQEGLDFIRQHKNIYISPNSVNLIKEFQMYSYKKYQGRIIDEPIDFMNHAVDAARYGAMGLKNEFQSYVVAAR